MNPTLPPIIRGKLTLEGNGASIQGVVIVGKVIMTDNSQTMTDCIIYPEGTQL